MTKNRVKDFRYRPGKAEVNDEDDDDDDEYESDEDDDNEEAQEPTAPAPKASTFPPKRKIEIDLSKADQQRTTVAPQAEDENLEGFVTASESEDDGDSDQKKAKDPTAINPSSSDEEDDSDSDSSEEGSSSDDEPKKPMLAPKFLSKAQRAAQLSTPAVSTSNNDSEALRLEKADETLRSQIALRAAESKTTHPDDEDVTCDVDDIDNLDEEAEYAAWKLRELKRVRRDRLAIEEKEAELAEIERRRGLSTAEREAEDAAHIAEQVEEKEGRGKMAFLQKYHHKGVFAPSNIDEQDEEVKAALSRDFAGARFEDDSAAGKDVLPEYMQIRDSTKLGRSSRTKYKDLRTEDTGQWGVVGGRKRDFDGGDDRFRSDYGRDDGRERTGANDVPVGERRDRDGPKKVRYE
jgi:microfibrillar-associated protein 1